MSQSTTTRQDGFATIARSVRPHKKKLSMKYAKFDDEGDAIESVGEFTLIDRYLDAPIGTAAAARALADWRRSWGR